MGPNEAGEPGRAGEPEAADGVGGFGDAFARPGAFAPSTAAAHGAVNEPTDIPAQVRRVVVAAVIERDGLFLAARRTEPPALAGRWEFPGGKVEPGETEAEALVRECREELGVLVEVGPPIGPEYEVGALTVRTYRAELRSGEPAPLECHDALRWLRPGERAVRELPWLDGDYVILDALEHSAG